MTQNRLEEEIRTKVVFQWLRDHGFALEDISVERSFHIQVGRGTYRIDGKPVKRSALNPRADVLVRAADGRNLFVVEVKAPNEKLGEKASAQALSYARLLTDGIAPFVVVTNGTDTEIYDSVSGELVSNDTVPHSHTYVKNNYKASGDCLAARSHALETFITLSPENLEIFCRNQVDYRMGRLRSDDILSGKKYIPQLYIENQSAREQFDDLLQDETRKVIIISGRPQTGKTNFVCYSVERLLDSGIACLFFPAIGLRNGLLNAICEDFEWEMGEHLSSYHLIHRRLSYISEQTQMPIYIFVDGWNETNQQLAYQIDQECQRLQNENIRIIISFTNLAAKRLLEDAVGNPSYLADATMLDNGQVAVLKIAPDKMPKNVSVVPIGKYTNQEIEAIYHRYSQMFLVKVPTEHIKIHNPFIIRVGMQYYRNRELPIALDEPKLMGAFIAEKSRRTVGLSENTIPDLLQSLGKSYIECDQAVSWNVIHSLWGLPVNQLPEGLFDAALLAQVSGEDNLLAIDFYNERERDYVIARLVRRWQDVETMPESLLAAFADVAKSQSLSGALRWFLPNHLGILESIVTNWDAFAQPELRRIVISALYDLFTRTRSLPKWADDATVKAMEDDDGLVRIEAVKLYAELLYDDPYNLGEIIPVKESTIRSFLSITDDETDLDDLFDYVIVKAITELHDNLMPEIDQPSEVTDILFILLYDRSHLIQVNAAKVLGQTVPMLFLEEMRDAWLNHKLTGETLSNICNAGFATAIDNLSDNFYGPPMCSRGYLDVLLDNPHSLYLEYVKLKRAFDPIGHLATSANAEQFYKLIKSLCLTEDQLQSIKHLIDQVPSLLTAADYMARKYQLVLPLREFEDLQVNQINDTDIE